MENFFPQPAQEKFTDNFVQMVFKISTWLLYKNLIAFFGQCGWDEDGKLFYYQAEALFPTLEGGDYPEKYAHQQSWGEKLSERIDPRIYILSLEQGTIIETKICQSMSPASVKTIWSLVSF